MTLASKALKVIAPLAIAAAAMTAASAASANCPAWEYDAAATIQGTGAQFWQPQHYSVVAGGSTDVAYCNIARQTNATGYVATSPDFELYYDGANGYDLEIRVVGNCDTTLLINTANSAWRFDDDSNGDLQPRIYLPNAQPGTYDIWVGTYGSQLCNAELVVETF
jgi:hypothetical protein